MSDPPPDILIIVPDDPTAGRCSGWIADLPCSVFIQTDQIPDQAPRNMGVIEIAPPTSGDPGSNADARLPAEVSRRELRVVCRLLLEIVRLRRKLHSADRLEQSLRKAAMTDPLTELPNRREWEATLESRLAQASQDRPLCLAVIDLDHFKRVNSSRGHAVGDEVLQRAAASIRGSLREDDFVARLGGDEFGLLFWSPSPRVAADVVDRARAVVGRLDLDDLFADEADETGRKITASAGFCISAEGVSGEKYYACADAAMREAKRAGRNRTVAY